MAAFDQQLIEYEENRVLRSQSAIAECISVTSRRFASRAKSSAEEFWPFVSPNMPGFDAHAMIDETGRTNENCSSHVPVLRSAGEVKTCDKWRPA
jgi:hypothetical protein